MPNDGSIDAARGWMVPAGLFDSPSKREAYSRDTYFQEGLQQLSEYTSDVADFAHRNAILLLKPDAIVAHAVDPTLDWLAENGFRVVCARQVGVDRNLVRALWYFQWDIASAERRRLADLLLEISDSLVLVVTHDTAKTPTSVLLTELKGPTNPADRQPGQLRHLLGLHTYLLNMVHTPDDPADVVRELAIYFGNDARKTVLEEAISGLDRSAEARDIGHHLYSQTPQRSFERGDAEDVLRGELRVNENDQDHGTDTGWATLLRDAWDSDAKLDPWAVIVVGSSVLPMRTGSAPSPQLHQSTIPRRLVHKTSVSEVLLTSLDRDGDTFVIGAQLPRMHAYYGDHIGSAQDRHDPLIVMEATRQASIALIHKYFDVPIDHQFLVRTFNGDAEPGSVWDIGTSAANVVIEAKILRHFRTRDALSGVAMELVVTRDGAPMMVVDGSFSWHDPKEWAGIRRATRSARNLGESTEALPCGARTSARKVGRENARNVVVGEGVDSEFPLVVDQSHPSLFDHPLDHAPGNLLIEAGRQASIAVSSRRTSSIPRLEKVCSRFTGFVEFDVPASCAVQVTDTGTRCEVTQQGDSLAVVELHFSEERHS